MNVWVRRAAIGAVAIVALLLVALGAVYAVSAARLGADHEATAHAFDPEQADIEHGRHLSVTFGCTECHGGNLAGLVLIDGMPFARVAAPNLTAGREGGALTDEEWELAVRHGIGPDGRALVIMPSAEYVYLSDRDLADVVAYARTLPAVPDALPPRAFGPVGRTLIALGQLPFAPDLMHDNARHLAAPESAPTAEFGHYLTRLCTGCHGQNLAGAQPGDPESPPAPDLTPAGALGGWTFEAFDTAMRTGATPDGRQLDPRFMPWRSIGNATETGMRAMWAYLTTLAPAAARAED